MHAEPRRKTSGILGCALVSAASVCVASSPATAVEYGISDYLLGYSIPMAGYTPPPGIYYQDTFYLYNGSAGRNVTFPFGHNVALGADLNFTFNISTAAWYTDATILGGTLGFAATVPVGGERTSVGAAFPWPFGIHRQLERSESSNALGDSAFSALLGWHSGESHWNLTVTGFTPTGYYTPDGLSFTGLNRPAIDIKGAYTFLSLQTGIELTVAAGTTINAINNKTAYQSGAEFHLEYAANQHLPGGAYVGVGGYFYQQYTGDSGALIPAILPFKGRIAAVGPLVGYTFKVGSQEVNLAARWFHEFAAKNRVQGDSIFASLSFRL
jgi:hypothetical protein